MTDSTESGRSVRTSRRLHGWLVGRGGRFRWVFIGAALLLGGIVGGYNLAYRDLTAARDLSQQLLSEGQKLRAQNADQNAQLAALQARLARVQAALEAIMPTENTYNVNANESVNAASGRLTVALIGSPTNEGIKLNINGEQHPAIAGDVIHVALDPTMACQVGVQSFDMFKAVLTASCARVKPP